MASETEEMNFFFFLWTFKILINSNLDSLKMGSFTGNNEKKKKKMVKFWISKQILQELALGETW